MLGRDAEGYVYPVGRQLNTVFKLDIPILYHKSIDERGGKAFGFQCLGDGIMEFFPTSNTMIYELPSIESVLGYMKTKNERLIRPIKE